MTRLILLAIAAAIAFQANAACVNRFTNRREASRQVVTLLTGKMTFQEAQALAADIQNRRAEPIEWIDDKGKTLARQYGELKVVRPMPVACDDKPSGVIVIVTFATVQTPVRQMKVKLRPDTIVAFDEQG